MAFYHQPDYNYIYNGNSHSIQSAPTYYYETKPLPSILVPTSEYMKREENTNQIQPPPMMGYPIYAPPHLQQQHQQQHQYLRQHQHQHQNQNQNQHLHQHQHQHQVPQQIKKEQLHPYPLSPASDLESKSQYHHTQLMHDMKSNSIDYSSLISCTISPSLKRRRKAKPAAVELNQTFPCPKCSKVFQKPYNLKSHMKTHSTEKPYTCNICDRKFARSHDKKRHEALHDGEKNFKCEGYLKDGVTLWGCGKKFARSDALLRHFRTESGWLCVKPLMMESKATGDTSNPMLQYGPPMQQFSQSAPVPLPQPQPLQYQQSHTHSQSSSSQSPQAPPLQMLYGQPQPQSQPQQQYAYQLQFPQSQGMKLTTLGKYP